MTAVVNSSSVTTVLVVGKRDTMREWGSLIMGLGLVFYGMGVMGDSMSPRRTSEPFMDLMMRMETPRWAFSLERSSPV